VAKSFFASSTWRSRCPAPSDAWPRSLQVRHRTAVFIPCSIPPSHVKPFVKRQKNARKALHYPSWVLHFPEPETDMGHVRRCTPALKPHNPNRFRQNRFRHASPSSILFTTAHSEGADIAADAVVTKCDAEGKPRTARSLCFFSPGVASVAIGATGWALRYILAARKSQ
jgi:hypothetical protein